MQSRARVTAPQFTRVFVLKCDTPALVSISQVGWQSRGDSLRQKEEKAMTVPQVTGAAGAATVAMGTGSARAVIDAAGATHVGRQRRRNEDAYLIATLQRSMLIHDASPEAARGWLTGEPAGSLLIVADGMGGHAGGDIASWVAVQTIAGYVLNVMPWATRQHAAASVRDPSASLPEVREQLSSAIIASDSTVKSTGIRTGTPQMGTTLTAAFVIWPMLYVAHVGDSRCCLLRSGKLNRLTTDHTLAQQVTERSPGIADVPFAWHSMLWNSLGGSGEVPQPQITKTTLELDDLVLLCSDGLTKHVSDEEIAALLTPPRPNADRCAALIQRANDAGGTDNITAVLATFRTE
jgi:protein phosphatase